MNERIETLAKAAGYDMINKAAMRALGFDVEKFAELIIEDACRALNPMLRDMISRGQAVDMIKQHFGVEE